MSKKLNYWLVPDIMENVTTEAAVLNDVCKVFNVKEEQIRDKCRLRPIAEARHTIFYILNKRLHLPLIEIGRRYNRNHATVINSIKQVNNWLETDDYFQEKTKNLLTKYKLNYEL